ASGETTTVNKSAIDSDVPWPGSTYIITDANTGDVLTLRSGELVMESAWSPSAHSSIYWKLVSDNGSYGLRNAASGSYIG
ncbi:hypothetical protein M011DRAFT_370121, partial [Sporormia fimetaria CBS 119925]